jgi:hypothetical protein
MPRRPAGMVGESNRTIVSTKLSPSKTRVRSRDNSTNLSPSKNLIARVPETIGKIDRSNGWIP